MTKYTANTCVVIRQLSRQQEGQEFIIGRADTSTFLVLPADAVEILDYLATGITIGEAQSLYQIKYNEIPDIQDLLSILEDAGFVEPIIDGIGKRNKGNIKEVGRLHKAEPVITRYHFNRIPQAFAQKLFSRPVLYGCSLLIGLSLFLLILEPSILPTWNALFFSQNLTLMRILLTVMNYLALFLHEMAHLVAARSVGVSSRLGIGNRLWFLVAETDMTGIWSVPREQRYLPLLAGSLLDATSAAVIVLILYAHHQQWLPLHPIAHQFSQAMLLIYLIRLLWQCFLFVRTDFYFVIANYFGCKNLMKDTEVFLRNLVVGTLKKKNRINQAHIPKSEMQVIRWYALIWIMGRLVAFYVFIFITLPLFWNYTLQISSILSIGYRVNSYAFVDAIVMSIITVGPMLAGFWLWIHNSRKLLR